MVSSLIEDLRWRGLIYQTTGSGLEARLGGGGLTLYSGFDPSADSLTVGNLLALCTLRRFQEAGHRPIALVGGGTGMVGDPSGKAEARPLRSRDEVRADTAAIGAQLARFVDLSDGALVLDNGDWLWGLGLLAFLGEVGRHFGVGQMTAKDSVRSRLGPDGDGISFTELSYMLLQAYDFLHLHDHWGCQLQIGGSDQWGNITMGVDLVRRARAAEVFGLTTPLVVKADGTKLGKTESGAVWLDPHRTSPYQLYQFFVRTEDSLVGIYLRYFTWLSHERIEELDQATAQLPEGRQAQRVLAREVTSLVHGAGEASRAERAAAALFGGELAGLDEASLLAAFGDAPSSVVARDRLAGGGVALVDLLAEVGLVASRSAGLRIVSQGGAYVNNRREDDPGRRLGPSDLVAGRWLVLRRGRRQHHLVEVRQQ